MFEMKPYDRKNASVGHYDPFREMENFERSFFDDPFRRFDKMLAEFKTDITDNGADYLLETDLPGFRKEDITLDINGDTLTLRAERHSDFEEKEKKHKYIRCERSFGSYCRQFDISGVDAAAIKAKYENGVLKLTLPKKAPAASANRNVPIE